MRKSTSQGVTHWAQSGKSQAKVGLFLRDCALMGFLGVAWLCHGDQCQAQTPVVGQISGQTTWTAANSPYLIAQNAELVVGATLMLQPGTEVRLSKGASLIVRGTLIARGTGEFPIRFTSTQQENPAPQDWGMLTFEGNGAAAKVDSGARYQSGSILEHVVVEYGHGLYFNAAAPFLSHCTIRYNRKERGGGIYAHGCNPVVRSCLISNNIAEREGGGIRTVHGQPILMANRIVRNTALDNGGGISLDYQSAQIINNRISYNYAPRGGGVSTGKTQVGQTSISGQSHSKPLISGNQIINNTATFSGGGVLVRGTPRILENTIAGNRIGYSQFNTTPSSSARIDRDAGAGAGIRVHDTYGGPLLIQKNIIAGNRGAFWGAAMSFDRAAGVIQKNLIFGNQAVLDGGGISILVLKSSKSFISEGHGSEWSILQNDFRANRPSLIEFAQARFPGEQSIAIHRCNFEEHLGKVFVNHTSVPMDATDNWWGTQEDAAVRERIQDFFTNRSLGKVNVSLSTEAHSGEDWPRMTDAQLQWMSQYPEGLRAGQGFNRLPDTPPSVTIVWNSGELKDPAGYLIHFSQIEPRFKEVRVSDGARISASCDDGPSPVDVSNVTKAELSGFEVGSTYEFFVTAYDFEGRESAMSEPFVVKVER